MPRFRVKFTVSFAYSTELEAENPDGITEIIDDKIQLTEADLTGEIDFVKMDYNIDSIIKIYDKTDSSING